VLSERVTNFVRVATPFAAFLGVLFERLALWAFRGLVFADMVRAIWGWFLFQDAELFGSLWHPVLHVCAVCAVGRSKVSLLEIGARLGLQVPVAP
jgi:hypothetical protein